MTTTLPLKAFIEKWLEPSHHQHVETRVALSKQRLLSGSYRPFDDLAFLINARRASSDLLRNELTRELHRGNHAHARDD